MLLPPFLKVFSSETSWPIKAKFHVEPPWEGETEVYIDGPGHMTKMATTPIKNLFLQNQSDSGRCRELIELMKVYEYLR